MPLRSVRRRHLKQVARLGALSAGQRRVIGTWHLTRWRAEAHRRADDLNAAAVWDLPAEARATVRALDPSGELVVELARVCADAVAQVAGRHLVGGSRPLADRARLQDRVRGPRA